MRKTASFLLGLSLLSPACKMASRPEAADRLSTSEAAHETVSDRALRAQSVTTDSNAAPAEQKALSRPIAPERPQVARTPPQPTRAAPPMPEPVGVAAPDPSASQGVEGGASSPSSPPPPAAPRASQPKPVNGAAFRFYAARGRAATMSRDGTGGDAFHDWGRNPWVDATKDHLSTFAADVESHRRVDAMLVVERITRLRVEVAEHFFSAPARAEHSNVRRVGID